VDESGIVDNSLPGGTDRGVSDLRDERQHAVHERLINSRDLDASPRAQAAQPA
jgi:hypothetical protein